MLAENFGPSSDSLRTVVGFVKNGFCNSSHSLFAVVITVQLACFSEVLWIKGSAYWMPALSE